MSIRSASSRRAPRRLALLVVTLLGTRGAAPLAAQDPVAGVIAAEHAFARLSVDSGAHAAFVANLDERSIVFRPRATDGRSWYAAHRPRGPEGTLFWTPAWVGAAASGDLGFSTGPYRFEMPRERDTVRVGGSFATVWGRRPGEPWRVLVDLGVGDRALPIVDSTRAVSVAPAGVARAGIAAPTAVAELLRVDSALGARYGDFASPDGLAARAAEDVRLLREGAGARTGRESARVLAETAGAAYASVPIGGAVARTGDLGYTYGTYTRSAPAEPDAGNYLRVWRREPAGWRLVLDVASPVPRQP